MRTLIGLAAAVLVAVVLLAEVTVRPTPEDRLVLYAVFGAAFVLTILGGWGLLSRARRLRNLRTVILLIPVGAVAIAAAAIGGAALTMFFSPHDLRLALVALALGVGLGTALALAVARPLNQDLQLLARTARRVAAGDLGARTGVERSDQVGELAAATDRMIEELAAAEAERRRHEGSRRSFLTAVSHRGEP